MAKTKSAQKRARLSVERRLRNRSVRSMAKTYISKAERLIFHKELDQAQGAVVQAVSVLDRAARKGVIHPSNAARRKSRLMKRLNQALASSPP